MWSYLIRRILYAIPVLIGVNFITFALFFLVNSPDDMARAHLGQKYIKQEAIERWKKERGYDLPVFYNDKASGLKHFTETLFFNKSVTLFAFDFGASDNGRDIDYDISVRMWPSLAVAVPVLLVGLFINIVFAILMAFFRATRIDTWGTIVCIVMLSISGLFYIIGGQYVLAKMLRLVPISGFESGLSSIHFIILPVIVAVLAGIGSGARWYRTIFLEEIHQDYVRTARAKGLADILILFKHVLRNAMLPILTSVVVIIPSLFMGSLILESFFGIPGLGSYTIEAIQAQDFAIVRAMVFLGSVLYIIGLILTDISYTIFDPRVRLN